MQDTASLRDEHGESYGWPMISIGSAAPVRLDETIAFSISAGHNVLAVFNHPDGKAMEEAEKNSSSTPASQSASQPGAQAAAVAVASPQTGDSAGTLPYALAAMGALGLLALVAVLLGQGKKQRHQ